MLERLGRVGCQRLQEIIDELAAEVRLLPQYPRLAELRLALRLMDGTVLAALPSPARAPCEGIKRRPQAPLDL